MAHTEQPAALLTYARTAHLPLDELNEFPGNARVGNVPAILASLRRNAQYRALVVREEEDGRLTILAGNHTAKALSLHGPGPCDYRAKLNGVEHPCGVCQNQPWEPGARVEIVRCDDDTARRVVLADNKTNDLGTFDQDALAELISYLDDDLEGTGYTQSDVELLIAPPPSLEELADTYGAPESDDFWPVMKFRVPPETRDAFLDLTAGCPHKDDDAERFRYLVELARATTDTPGATA